MSRQEELAAALREVRERVGVACRAASRAPEDVVLIAVSKTWPASDVALLSTLGVEDFGENREREAREKAAVVKGVRWHFVGAVQTNKARTVARFADLVHSVDRPALALALADGASRAGRTLDVLVQVSFEENPARAGVAPEAVASLAETIETLPTLRLAGLMALPPLGTDATACFERLAQASARLTSSHPQATVISAGMSGDLEQAIAHGATHVRVGTALFGHRGTSLR